MNPKDIALEDISVGDAYTFTRIWMKEDVDSFAKLSGDTNPLHMEEGYASTTQFGKRLVHGMLVASLCSQFVGMYIPGKRCLYLSQTLSFKNPVFIGDEVQVTGTVSAVSLSTRIVTISISITKGEEKVLTGTASAQVL